MTTLIEKTENIQTLIKLDTKLKMSVDGRHIGEGFVIIFPKKRGTLIQTMLRIYASPKMYNGRYWEFYLNTLLHISSLDYEKGLSVKDSIAVDFGANILFTGLRKVYREIINIQLWRNNLPLD